MCYTCTQGDEGGGPGLSFRTGADPLAAPLDLRAARTGAASMWEEKEKSGGAGAGATAARGGAAAAAAGASPLVQQPGT